MVALNGWKFPLTHFPIVSRSDLGTCPNRRRGKDKIRKFGPQPKTGDLLTSDDLPLWFNCIIWQAIFRGLQNTHFEWWTAMTERFWAKVFQIKFPLLAKFASIFLGTLCSFQGKNDKKLLDTEGYHLISLSTYTDLSKKHMSLCPSGWYQFLKIWPLAHGLQGTHVNITEVSCGKLDLGSSGTHVKVLAQGVTLGVGLHLSWFGFQISIIG